AGTPAQRSADTPAAPRPEPRPPRTPRRVSGGQASFVPLDENNDGDQRNDADENHHRYERECAYRIRFEDRSHNVVHAAFYQARGQCKKELRPLLGPRSRDWDSFRHLPRINWRYVCGFLRSSDAVLLPPRLNSPAAAAVDRTYGDHAAGGRGRV